MGFQSSRSRELAQSRRAGLQLDTSYAGDGIAHLKSTRRGTGAGRDVMQVTSTTNLIAPGSASVLRHDSSLFGVQLYH